MVPSKHITALDNLALIVSQNEKACKKFSMETKSFSNRFGRNDLEKIKLVSIEGENQFKKSYNNEIKLINHKYNELKKKLETWEEKTKILIKKQEELEKLRHKLESNNDLSNKIELLDNLRNTLKYYKMLLPAEFDYSSKKITGFLFKKDSAEYHGFELDPKNEEANTKYLWKQMEKLFMQAT